MTKKVLALIMCLNILVGNIAFGAKFNMTYIYGGSSYTNMVDETKGCLNEVSPSYFDLNNDGTLKLTASVSPTFISNMHERRIAVVPFLSNHWNTSLGRAALANRENLANQIVDAINTYNLDGINVDIENVNEKDKESYTDFVKILSEKLPEGKTLAVAVAANPNGWTTGWHGSYDYAKLGEYADYLMLMTYDEHYQNGPAGAVMGYDFMEKSVQYALKYVPSEKIVLGLAFYGRYWNTNGNGGRAVTYSLIEKIFNDYTPEIRYDESSKTMVGRIHVSQEQAQNDAYIFDAGTYDFWYDNIETLPQKIGLVTKYNLKGTGSWALGQENTEIWKYYKEWLNGVSETKGGPVIEIIDTSEINEGKPIIIKPTPVITPNKSNELTFTDVGVDRWSYTNIKFVTQNNLMIGESLEKFNPDTNLTRAEAVTTISRLLKNAKMQIPESEQVIELTDIESHWAKETILECMNLGLVSGYEDKSFKPDENISRQEIAVILSKLNLQIQDKKNNMVFSDVTKDLWSYESITNMINKEILSGYDDNTFKPENSITREEMATIIYNISNKVNK